jgi:iron complex transport system ATP-binding protein
MLTARNIHVSYGDHPALTGVDITLAPGEIVSLLGPNGSGKSTLIQALLGNVTGSGEIHWFDQPLKKWNRRELARRVAYLPQAPVYQPAQRVIEVLQLGRSPYWAGFGLESPRDGEVVARVAGQLQLADILHRSMDELSGGQRQRVFVGRCLVQEPAALLLDEPSTYLDLKHQVELCQLLRQLSQTQSIGILMASHDLNLAIGFSDRIIVLSNGQIAASGGIDVLQPETISSVYGVRMIQLQRPDGTPVLVPQI